MMADTITNCTDLYVKTDGEAFPGVKTVCSSDQPTTRDPKLTTKRGKTEERKTKKSPEPEKNYSDDLMKQRRSRPFLSPQAHPNLSK